jgi:hypothetical protein
MIAAMKSRSWRAVALIPSRRCSSAPTFITAVKFALSTMLRRFW